MGRIKINITAIMAAIENRRIEEMEAEEKASIEAAIKAVEDAKEAARVRREENAAYAERAAAEKAERLEAANKFRLEKIYREEAKKRKMLAKQMARSTQFLLFAGLYKKQIEAERAVIAALEAQKALEAKAAREAEVKAKAEAEAKAAEAKAKRKAKAAKIAEERSKANNSKRKEKKPGYIKAAYAKTAKCVKSLMILKSLIDETVTIDNENSTSEYKYNGIYAQDTNTSAKLLVAAMKAIKATGVEAPSLKDAERIISRSLNEADAAARRILDSAAVKVSGSNMSIKDTNCRNLAVYFYCDKMTGRTMARTKLQTTQDSRLTRTFMDDREEKMLILSEGVARSTKFDKNILSVSLDPELREESDSLFGNEIYVLYRTDKSVRVYTKPQPINGEVVEENVFYSYETGEKVKLTKAAVNKLYKYNFVAITASGKRNLTTPFMREVDYSEKFKMLDMATCGALKIMHEKAVKNLEKVLTDSDFKEFKISILKQYGYIANVLTQSVNLGIVPGCTIFNGKLQNFTGEVGLHEENIKRLNEAQIAIIEGRTPNYSIIPEVSYKEATIDGLGYINAEVLAEMYNKYYKSIGLSKVVTARELEGHKLQVRPGTVKASFDVVSAYTYSLIIKGAREIAEKNGIEVSNVGDPNKSLYFVDMNAKKLATISDENITFEVLAVAKSSEGGTSKQMLKNFVYAAQQEGKLDEALNDIMFIMEQTIAEAEAKNFPGKKAKDKIVTPQHVRENIYGYDSLTLLKDICHMSMYSIKSLYETVAEQHINSVVDSIDRMRLNLNVRSFRLSSDPTFIISGGELNGIMSLGDCFINDDSISELVMFKYPVATCRENYACVNKELDSLERALQCSGLSEEKQRGIYEYFAGLRNTVMVLPAKMFVTYACAGLDFDYDGCSCLIKVNDPQTPMDSMTNKYVDMLMRATIDGYFGVFINNEHSSDADIPDEKMDEIFVQKPNIKLPEAFLKFCEDILLERLAKNKNYGVGELTNVVDTANLLLFLPDDKMVPLAMEMFNHTEKFRLGGHDGCDYIGLKELAVGINTSIVITSQSIEEALLKHINNVAPTPENIRKILMDIVYFGRNAEELTIDAEKKIYDVFVSFFQTYVKAESTIHYNVGFTKWRLFNGEEFTKDTIHTAFSISRGNLLLNLREKTSKELGDTEALYNNRGKIKAIVYNDIFSDIQNKTLRSFIEKDVLLKTRVADKISLATNKEVIKDLESMTNDSMARDIYCYIVKPYTYLKYAFYEEMEELKRKLMINSLTKDEYSFVKDSIKEKFSSEIAVLSNRARMMLNNYSVIDAGRIMVAASLFYNDNTSGRSNLKVKPDSKNTCFLTVAEEFGLAYLMSAFSENICGYEIDIPEEIGLENGTSVEVLFGRLEGYDDIDIKVPSRVEDGEYTIYIDDEGQTYIVRPVTDVIEEERKDFTEEDGISLIVSPKAWFEPGEFFRKGFYKLDHFDSKKINYVINRAESFTFKKAVELGVKKFAWRNVVIANNVKFGDKIVKEFPLCTFMSNSGVMADYVDGLTVSKDLFAIEHVTSKNGSEERLNFSKLVFLRSKSTQGKKSTKAAIKSLEKKAVDNVVNSKKVNNIIKNVNDLFDMIK